MTATRISDWMRSNVLGLVAMFMALSGAAYAAHPGGADTISFEDIIDQEVKSPDVAPGREPASVRVVDRGACSDESASVSAAGRETAAADE